MDDQPDRRSDPARQPGRHRRRRLGRLRLPGQRRRRPPDRPLHHPPLPDGAGDSSGSTGTGTGWQARPLVLQRRGHASSPPRRFTSSPTARANTSSTTAGPTRWSGPGGRYYPKLQIAVPFTPATGRRFLTRPGSRTPARRSDRRAPSASPRRTSSPRSTSPSAPKTRPRRWRGRWACCTASPSSSTGRTGATPVSTTSSPTFPAQAQDDPQGTRDGAGLRRLTIRR